LIDKLTLLGQSPRHFQIRVFLHHIVVKGKIPGRSFFIMKLDLANQHKIEIVIE